MSKVERGIRAKAVVAMSIGLADRLRILLTGRVLIYATGVKPYCEIYLATRLPRDAQERAGIVAAMKAAQHAGKEARGGEAVVEAPAGNVRTQGAARNEGRGVVRSKPALAPEGDRGAAVPLPRLQGVARGPQPAGAENGRAGVGLGVCGCEHPKRAHRNTSGVVWCDLCPNPKFGSRRMHAFGEFPGAIQACTREQPHDGPCNGLPCDHVAAILRSREG